MDGWLAGERDRGAATVGQGDFGASIEISTPPHNCRHYHDLLRDGGMTGELDLLIIDIDGNDYHVWREIEAVRPARRLHQVQGQVSASGRMIMPRDDKHVWDGSDWFSASLASL